MSLDRLSIGLMLGAAIAGAAVQDLIDHHKVENAQRGEWQANGLEDECRATLSRSIETSLDEQANGDYQLSVYGGRRLVCKEKDVRVSQQPTSEEPLVLECRH